MDISRSHSIYRKLSASLIHCFITLAFFACLGWVFNKKKTPCFNLTQNRKHLHPWWCNQSSKIVHLAYFTWLVTTVMLKRESVVSKPWNNQLSLTFQKLPLKIIRKSALLSRRLKRSLKILTNWKSICSTIQTQQKMHSVLLKAANCLPSKWSMRT